MNVFQLQSGIFYSRNAFSIYKGIWYCRGFLITFRKRNLTFE